MVNQRGGILFYILIGVILFGSLMYVYTRSGTTSTGMATKAKNNAQTADLMEYTRMVTTAVDKLLLRGCSADQISYEAPTGQDVNAKAPSDKTCHVFRIEGGNIRYRLELNGVGCDLTSLSVGQSCGGTIYAGIFNGSRLYTTQGNNGTMTFVSNSLAGTNFTGANSAVDGLPNTNYLLTATSISGYPFLAAVSCRALGSKWYLPSYQEVQFLCNQKSSIGGYSAGFWWSSTYHTGDAYAPNSACAVQTRLLNQSYNVRCARRD